MGKKKEKWLKTLERKKQIRTYLQKYKTFFGCKYCSENNHVCLEFHHKNPQDKKYAIGSALISWTKTLNELIKCEVVCSNCHKKLHFSDKPIKNKKVRNNIFTFKWFHNIIRV